MSDNILGSTLLALIVALAVGAAATLLDDARPGVSAAATPPTEIVRLPQVTVTGHRWPGEPVNETSAKAVREPSSAPGEKSG